MALLNKRVLLTGGAGGIGELTAAALASEGANVVVMSRRGAPAGIAHVCAELSTFEGIAEGCGAVAREEPDILINMAGVQYFGPMEAQSLHELRDSYLVNLFAPVALSHACLPAMRRRGTGQIVNIGSILGSIGVAHFAAYSSAKAGLRAFSEALRRELVDTDIAVTYIAPRAVRTQLMTAKLQAYAELTGMTVDRPQEIAEKIVGAVKRRDKDVYIGLPERIVVGMNAVLPRLIDAATAGRDRRAKTLFAS